MTGPAIPLAALQKAFQDCLLGRSRDLLDHLADGRAADKETLIQVYGNAYVGRLQEILDEDFPGLRALMGGDAFDALTRDYIFNHPSRHWSVSRVGGKLAAFVSERHAAHPEYAQMAAFEWAQALAFSAPVADGREVLDPDALASVPAEAWPGVGFRFHPALSLIAADRAVPPFQRLAADGEAGDAGEVSGAGPVTWAVWRDGESLEVRYRDLDADEAWAIEAAMAGAAFGALCDGLSRWLDPGLVPGRAAGLLQGWVGAGLVSGLTGAGEPIT